MPIERYCTNDGCPGAEGCTNAWRDVSRPCVYEYVAADSRPEYRWLGEDPPPRRWRAADGTIVYRSLADYYDWVLAEIGHSQRQSRPLNEKPGAMAGLCIFC